MRRLSMVAGLVASLALASSVYATTENVGGGTWNHGSSLNLFPPGKHCYSEFVQPQYWHSATAIIGTHTSKVYQPAGNWANAAADGGLSETCYAYWAYYN